MSFICYLIGSHTLVLSIFETYMSIMDGSKKGNTISFGNERKPLI